MATTTKHCNGLAGRPAHDAPTTGFGVDKHTKDGLMRYCKECMSAYHKARKGTTITTTRTAKANEPIPENPPVAPVVDPVSVAEVETDAGQATLASAANDAAAARRKAGAEARKRQRAAAKAKAGEQPQA